ncbi:MAG: NfeD family protein [Acidobacteriota bacterium]|nr:NfeD family protein [Acidobacteriota bacterium]
MTWESIFLGCFVFGFVLSLIAFLAGSSHLHLHFHGHGHIGHVGHAHGGGSGVSKFNFGTIAAFLTWFGGAGYILSNWGGLGLLAVLALSAITGVAGGALIFLFAAKVLAPADKPLNPSDFRVIGALGTVSSTVFPAGTGEMIFVQQGRRAGMPIRSEDGALIPAGKEVVVTRYEDGIAYVREWDELTA